MTRLGFYIIHNNKYKLIKTVNIPWNFTIGGPDSNNPIVDFPTIGEWQPKNLIHIVSVEDIVFKDDYQFVIKRFKDVITENKEEESLIKETLYRITYNGIGVYEALRLTISKEDWDNFLNDDKVSWLLVPPFEYKEGYQSFFTADGYERFKTETLPLISQYLDEKTIKTETIEIVEQHSEENNFITLSEEKGGEDETPKPIFEDWVTEYFNDILFNEKGFFDIFNTDKTYIIIAEEDTSIMGFLVVQKGRTYVNFKEHDYRIIINALYPTIRQDMITFDDSFGGYDDDPNFSQDSNNNKCDHFLIDHENKGINTYPNMF